MDAERIRRQLLDAEAQALRISRPSFEARTKGTHGDLMAGRVGRMVDLEEKLRDRQRRDYSLIDLAYEVLYGAEWTDGLASIAPPVWADVLAHRFCNAETWEATARAIAQAALDMVDANGLTATVAGYGMAEDEKGVCLVHTPSGRIADTARRAQALTSDEGFAPRGRAGGVVDCHPTGRKALENGLLAGQRA